MKIKKNKSKNTKSWHVNKHKQYKQQKMQVCKLFLFLKSLQVVCRKITILFSSKGIPNRESPAPCNITPSTPAPDRDSPDRGAPDRGDPVPTCYHEFLWVLLVPLFTYTSKNATRKIMQKTTPVVDFAALPHFKKFWRFWRCQKSSAIASESIRLEQMLSQFLQTSQYLNCYIFWKVRFLNVAR